jgi:hypothetical protein
MKTTISKELRHSLLIEDVDLKSLYAFISSRYNEVDVGAKCIDGSKLESKEVDEIVLFDNPSYRKIKSISFYAKSDFDERLSLGIWADGVPNVDLEVESKNDEQALYISREILNKFAEMKPWYDLLARVSISYVLCGLWFLWSMSITASQILGKSPPSATFAKYSIIETFNILLLLGLIAVAVIYPLDRVQKRLFPKVFFLLGKQKKTMETIKRTRNFVFSGLILTIVTGILVNIVSNWLLR